jgi:hypothetical protein
MSAYIPGWPGKHVQPEQFQLEYAWAGLRGDELIALGGLEMMWPGVAQSWFLLKPGAFQGYVHRLVRTLKRRLDETIAQASLHRIEANVVCGHAAACRLVECLGFLFEGRRRRFGPDRSDYDLYAWVKEE